jgi:hypothetical protein
MFSISFQYLLMRASVPDPWDFATYSYPAPTPDPSWNLIRSF